MDLCHSKYATLEIYYYNSCIWNCTITIRSKLCFVSFFFWHWAQSHTHSDSFTANRTLWRCSIIARTSSDKFFFSNNQSVTFEFYLWPPLTVSLAISQITRVIKWSTWRDWKKRKRNNQAISYAAMPILVLLRKRGCNSKPNCRLLFFSWAVHYITIFYTHAASNLRLDHLTPYEHPTC